MKMAPKIDLEPTLGSNFSFLEASGAMQKYHDFLMPFLSPPKSEKLAQGQPRGASGPTTLDRVSVFLEYGPQGGPARDLVQDTKSQITRYKG